MQTALNYLKQLEFSETEAKIYLTLLKTGPLSVAELAKAIHINRTAVYPYTTALMEKGIIAEILQETRKKLVAADPELLQTILKRKLSTLQTLETQFPDILNALQESYTQPKIETNVDTKYYKGRNGVKTIYEECLKSPKIRSYVNLATVNNVLPENTHTFTEALKKNKQTALYEIIENTAESKKLADRFQRVNKSFPQYNYKFLPLGIRLSATDILIYDQRVAIINVGDTNNITGVVMQNPDYYNNSKELFDLMWKMLPTNKKNDNPWTTKKNKAHNE